jgi:hypothetical protein
MRLPAALQIEAAATTEEAVGRKDGLGLVMAKDQT